jgi:hypothetical protein
MRNLPAPCVPVSWGELLDKISILEIKRQRIAEPAARQNVTREREALRQAGEKALTDPAVAVLFAALREVNERLWEIEESIRREEARERFGPEFIRLARSVYRSNDQRAVLKHDINLLLGSELIEEKSYSNHADNGIEHVQAEFVR